MYTHWNEKHNTPDNAPGSFPFWFRIDKIVKCLHCNTECFISEAVNHHNQNHPMQELTITFDRDGQICSQCKYTSNVRETLLEHFKITHSKANPADLNVFVTEPILDYLLTLYRKRIMCLLCMQSFVLEDDYVKHHQANHQDQKQSSDFIEVEGVIFSCNSCQTQCNNEPQIIEHMRHHFQMYICNFCDSSFRFPNLVQKHHTSKHNIFDKTFRLPNVRSQVDKYLSMSLTFENGLICKKSDLVKTKYGNISKLISTLEKWNERELRLIGKIPRKSP